MEKVEKEYRIVTRMTIDGEEFRVEFKCVIASESEWVDLTDSRWYKWYDNELDARVAIMNHKKIDEYVPRVIYVK